MSTIDTAPFRKLLELRDEKKRLAAAATNVEEQITELQVKLTDALLEAGMPSMSVNHEGRRYTIFPTTKVRARAKDGDTASLHAALRDHGFGELVKPTVNANSLASLVAEFTADEEPIPEWLSDVITTYDDNKMSARKS